MAGRQPLEENESNSAEKSKAIRLIDLLDPACLSSCSDYKGYRGAEYVNRARPELREPRAGATRPNYDDALPFIRISYCRLSCFFLLDPPPCAGTICRYPMTLHSTSDSSRGRSIHNTYPRDFPINNGTASCQRSHLSLAR